MSNSRSSRRRLAVSQQARETRPVAPRWPWGGPSMSTTRRQMRQLEADGDIERAGVGRTGKPGRPAVLYQLTEQGRQKPKWSAPQLTKAIIEAISAREFKEVPYMLRLLWMEDREHARRFTRSLVQLVPASVRQTWRKEERMPI